MPESRVRKEAAEKKKQTRLASQAAKRADTSRHVSAPGSRQWVVPAFITIGLVGVLWLVVYYITASAQIVVPLMTDLGGWNIIIGMSCMAASFALATLWK